MARGVRGIPSRNDNSRSGDRTHKINMFALIGF